MTFDELFELIDDESRVIDLRVKVAVKRIIQAETDWRTEVKTLEDFIEILENEVNGETSKENVSKRLRTFETNIAGNAWEAESFTSLLEVFEYNQNKSLKEIFEEIKLELKR
tara:strand:- start:112 stop:447 length:336 start_codon:yes stop_codon:yes gene_type:complete